MVLLENGTNKYRTRLNWILISIEKIQETESQ